MIGRIAEAPLNEIAPGIGGHSAGRSNLKITIRDFQRAVPEPRGCFSFIA
jgi:hypothetical protein